MLGAVYFSPHTPPQMLEICRQSLQHFSKRPIPHKCTSFVLSSDLILLGFGPVPPFQPLVAIVEGNLQLKPVGLLFAYRLELVVVTASDLPIQCFVLAVPERLFEVLMFQIPAHLYLLPLMSGIAVLEVLLLPQTSSIPGYSTLYQ